MKKIALVVALLAMALISRAVEPDANPWRALIEPCAAGRLDTNFLAVFESAVVEDVRRSATFSELSPDFFDWLDKHFDLRRKALLAIGEVGPKVATNLDKLRKHSESSVVTHPDLAIAFAAAWSAGKNQEPQIYWNDDWLVRGRQIPSMIESFDWYVQHENAMRLSLRNTPWRLLIYLVENLVPLSERDWVLLQYSAASTQKLRGLYAAVPYTLNPKRKEPCTLESFRRIGGPCTHNVQFADGVFASFGIPSGWSGGPGHTWPYWFEESTNGYRFLRINDLGNRTGTVRNPIGKEEITEDDLRLLASACSISPSSQTLASAAACAIKHLPTNAPPTTLAILVSAVRANPYCGEAWTMLARVSAQGSLTPELARDAWTRIAESSDSHLDLLITMLDRALPKTRKAGKPSNPPTIAGEQEILNTVAAKCLKAKRPDLGAKIGALRARCFESRGDRVSALKWWETVAGERAAHDAITFRTALDSVLRLLSDDPASQRQYLQRVLATVRPRSKSTSENALRSHSYAVHKLVEKLRQTDAPAADKIFLQELLVARAVTSQIHEFIGGKGGAAFSDTNPAATLVGLRLTLRDDNGETIVGSIQPLYSAGDGIIEGKVYGKIRGTRVELRAKQGWAVAGIVVSAGDRVNGLAILYAPLTATSKSEFEFSNWHGSPNRKAILLGGPGTRLTGISGRNGDDIDALGMVEKPAK